MPLLFELFNWNGILSFPDFSSSMQVLPAALTPRFPPCALTRSPVCILYPANAHHSVSQSAVIPAPYTKHKALGFWRQIKAESSPLALSLEMHPTVWSKRVILLLGKLRNSPENQLTLKLLVPAYKAFQGGKRGSRDKSTCCPFRGSKFSSQNWHGGSQSPAAPVPGDLMASYDFYGLLHTYAHMYACGLTHKHTE